MRPLQVNVVWHEDAHPAFKTWAGLSFPRGEKIADIKMLTSSPSAIILDSKNNAESVPTYRRMTPAVTPVTLPPSLFLAVFVEVETDAETEFNRWYDEEHLPRLIAVDGVKNAVRFCRVQSAFDNRNRLDERATKYLAVYEVENPDVVDSPAWLTAAGTEWTKKLRPHFLRSDRYMVQATSI